MNALIDISHVVLRTERLILRPWQPGDLDDLYEYASVDGVGQMAGWLPHGSKEVSQGILDTFIEGKKVFALELDGKVIGSLGIEKYNEKRYPELGSMSGREIGYVLSKEYWGRGLMPEAVQAVVEYAFSTLKLDFLMVGHFAWNTQSRKVIEKCGFQYVKTIDYTTRYETTEKCMEYILYNPNTKA